MAHVHDPADLVDQTLTMLEWPRIQHELGSKTWSRAGQQLALSTTPMIIDQANAIDAMEGQLTITHQLIDRFDEAPDILPQLEATDQLDEALPSLCKGGWLTIDQMLSFFEAVLSIQSLIKRLRQLTTTSLQTQLGLLNDNNNPPPRFTCLDQLHDLLSTVIEPTLGIRDDASSRLYEIRQRKRELESTIRSALDDLIRTQFSEDYFQDDYITIREDRMVLPLKSTMKGKVPGIIHASSASGATVFIEPESVVAANNELKRTALDEALEEEAILRQLSDVLRDDIDNLTELSAWLASFDLTMARFDLSQRLRGKMASIANDDEPEVLSAAQHPLMYLRDDDCIANTIHLPQPGHCLVLSGPNAGGKTVALKTIGLSKLLLQSAILPRIAQTSHLRLDGRVFALIGDLQDLHQGHSSFSGQMNALMNLITQARAGDLLLLDELASNTNPHEGEALAQALIEAFLERECAVIVTTHSTPLKALASIDPRFHNASLEIDPQTRQPTYKVLEGDSGESNSLDIARRLGLPTEVIERAIALLDPNLRDAHEQREQRQSIREQQAVLARETEEQRRAAQREISAQTEALREEYERFRQELAEARSELKRMREAARQSGETKIAFDTLTMIDEAVESKRPPQLDDDDEDRGSDVVVGDQVVIRDGKYRAEIIRGPDKHQEYELQAGSLRWKLHRQQFYRLKNQDVQQNIGQAIKSNVVPKGAGPNREDPAIPFTPQSTDNSVDLRGLRVDEALEAIDRFLDNLMLDGSIERAILIHGHGTQALREAVRGYLVDCPYTLTYRAGQTGEGDNGVTVIMLANNTSE